MTDSNYTQITAPLHFRRPHAKKGVQVRIYLPGEGFVTGSVRSVSRSRRTVWVLPDGKSDPLWFSERTDGAFRMKGTVSTFPPLELAMDAEPSRVLRNVDYERSAAELKQLVHVIRGSVSKLVPEDHRKLVSQVNLMEPLREDLPASFDGMAASYPFELRRRSYGVVTRSSSRSVWVSFPDRPETRFSRRPDGKYRLEGKNNSYPALMFEDLC